MTCKKCKSEIPDESIYCLKCGAKQTTDDKPRNTKSRGNGMGSIYRLTNGKWRAAITLGYDSNGKRAVKTKSGFKTKKEAVLYLEGFKAEKNTPKNVKFKDLFEQWSERHFGTKAGKSKQSSYRTAFKNCKALHWMNVSDIRLKDFQSVVDARAGGYYPKHDLKVLFSQMFKYAVKYEMVSEGALKYIELIDLPPMPKSKKDAFKDEEIAAIWADYSSGNSFVGYILVLIYTGMRLGELQALKMEDIHIDEKYMVGGIKTEAGINREIAIADKILPIVESLYASAAGRERLFNVPEKEFYTQYYEALQRAGVRRLEPHCCRHTYATLMAKRGVHSSIIKAAAGHANYSTTLQYTHIPLEEKINAVNLL